MSKAESKGRLLLKKAGKDGLIGGDYHNTQGGRAGEFQFSTFLRDLECGEE